MRKLSKSKEIIERDHKVLGVLTRPYELVVDHAEGSTIYDVDGNSYIDFASSVSVMNVGYHNRSVRDAVCSQIQKMTHCGFSDYYAEPPVKLSEKLCQMTGYGKVFLSNSGAESVEAAMKLAFWYTKKNSMIAFYRGFHGRTLGALSLTSSNMRHKEHYPSLNVVHSHYAYCYRCPLNLEYPGCGISCAKELESIIFRRELSPKDTAAIVVEPIQGEGGFIVPPPEFHQELRRICDENDILLIADEVQSGGFRTGKFMAMENFGVRADIVSMSKSIGGGVPLGATLSSTEIMSWPSGAHANTFGGNLIASAGGLATLEFMEQEKLGEKAVGKGTYIMKRLDEMKDRYPLIGDVRGIGLMIGVELVKEDKDPAIKKRDGVVNQAIENGLVLLPAGDSVIRFVPPLVISKEEIDKGLGIFEDAIKSTGR